MTVERDAHALLSVARCPVHGYIDLSDAIGGTQIIKRLVVSAPMQRLRRIKQLGFASLEYTGADHSRYSHAVGTMQVMRMILEVQGSKPYLHQVADALQAESTRSLQNAMQHLLVAALLQDCGELPYAVATSKLIRPNGDVFQMVEELIGEDAQKWPTKPVLTVACLYELRETLSDMDIESLAYLITGRYWTRQRPELRAAMHLLDGVLDADRIDYVARDAHHTGLGRVDVKAVVASLLDVDSEGPICSDPAQAASLLALRAHLYSTVYWSAPNRFRVMLVKELIHSILTDVTPAYRSEVLEADDLSVGFSRFLELDDIEVEAIVARSDSAKIRRNLGERAKIAQQVLSGTSNGYTERWLTSTSMSPDVKAITVPRSAFAEHFEDARFDDQRQLRVRLDGLGDLVPLESLNGPYSQVIADPRALLPIRGDVLIFEPTSFRPPEQYSRADREGWLGAGLKASMVAGGSITKPDTRHSKGFDGPRIFISYCSSDVELVAIVVDELRRLRRRYYLLAGAFQGVGGEPGRNSVDAVRTTDACLMVVSPSYQDRIVTQPNGNIAKELHAVSVRRATEAYPVVALGTCTFRRLDKMPWSLLGWDEAPFLGQPLDALDRSSISSAVHDALARIDSEFNPTPSS